MVLQRDRALTVFTKDVRLAVLRCTSCVNTGASRFRVAQSQAAALYAKALASSMLLSCFNKGEERVIMDFSAFAQDAPVTRICAESMRVGEVRVALLAMSAAKELRSVLCWRGAWRALQYPFAVTGARLHPWLCRRSGRRIPCGI